MSEPLDIEHLKSWIGREDVVDDLLTIDLVRKFQATLGLPGDPPEPGAIAPGLIHFCLGQPAVPMSGLGTDGHPRRGGFLPPVPLPRRMWAGSSLRLTGNLYVGDLVRRRSVIADLTVKEGKSGTLCFVAVDHRFEVGDRCPVQERQTIVYRTLDAGTSAPAAAPAAPQGEAVSIIDPSAALLFRYSALTFNTHRIHYDRPYATEVEGYPGLVVHGPLQATLLFHHAVHQAGGAIPVAFDFRSVSSLSDGTMLHLHAGHLADGIMPLWTASPDGPVAMQAEARWV